MDFLFSKGIRKVPKIPDKSIFYLLQPKKFSNEEFLLTQNHNSEKEIRFTTKTVDFFNPYNYKT